MGVHELNKLELRVSFNHKSNWSNERLRAARSNKFYCALVAAVRKIPLDKPGGPLSAGDEGKPVYTVQLTTEDAKAQVEKGAASRAKARIDAPPPDREEGGEGGDEVLPDPAALAAVVAENAARSALTRMPAAKSNALPEAAAVEIGDFLGTETTGLRQKVDGSDESMFRR